MRSHRLAAAGALALAMPSPADVNLYGRKDEELSPSEIVREFRGVIVKAYVAVWHGREPRHVWDAWRAKDAPHKFVKVFRQRRGGGLIRIHDSTPPYSP